MHAVEYYAAIKKEWQDFYVQIWNNLQNVFVTVYSKVQNSGYDGIYEKEKENNTELLVPV